MAINKMLQKTMMQMEPLLLTRNLRQDKAIAVVNWTVFVIIFRSYPGALELREYNKSF